MTMCRVEAWYCPTYLVVNTCVLCQQAWSAINSRAAPLLQAVPLLQTPIDFIRRQFENPR